MTTIVFDGDTFYSDTQASRMINGKMTGAFLTNKIHSNSRGVWAAAGSKYIADLYNDPTTQYEMSYLKWTFRWSLGMHQIDTYAGVTGETHIMHANKKHVYMLTATARQFTLKLFKVRLNLLSVKVAKTKTRRSNVNWMTIGSGHKIVDQYMLAGHSPEVAIKLTAIKDTYTNSLIQRVKCK
jgi:hypothetical protein